MAEETRLRRFARRRLASRSRAGRRGTAFLARNRLVAVGLALLVETVILLVLAYAEPSDVVGIPAAVATAIAGTVAVVFGPVDGAVVALAGAIVFAAAGGWAPGELAALGVWPAVVVAAGLFARRVARQRAALHSVVTAHELERQRLALELHDETAQTLTAALLALRRLEQAESEQERAAVSAPLHDLLEETIQAVRSLAGHLRPKALDDFGLEAAVERLAATFSAQTGIDVVFGAADAKRLPAEVELVLYRVVQETLATLTDELRPGTVRITLRRDRRAVTLTVQENGVGDPQLLTMKGDRTQLAGLRERLRLLDGTLDIAANGDGTTLRAEIPLPRGATATDRG